MGRTSAILLALLVATNAAWFLFTRGGGEDAREAEVAALRERVRAIEAAQEAQAAKQAEATQEAKPAGATLAGVAETEPRGGKPAAEKTRRPAPATSRKDDEAAARARRAQDASQAREQVGRWKADVLQIQDPGRREAALVAFEDGIRSRDEALATASLRSLYELRDSAYDKSRFRDAVRSRMDDADASVRQAADYALLQVEPEPSDTDRLLDVLEAHPEDTGPLIVGAWLAKNRVEGRLADLYVRALATDDARAAVNVANQLRGMWVTAEVERALVEAYRRAPEGERAGLWLYVLGQVRPTREPRVALLFEMLKSGGSDAPQLLDRALDARNLDPGAASKVAALALETLPAAPNRLTRSLCLKLLRQSGTAAQAEGLRAYAENPMVDEAFREQAAEVVHVLERR